MYCPVCKTCKTAIVNTGDDGVRTYRKRICKSCGYSFYTHEDIDDSNHSKYALNRIRNSQKL